MVAQKRRVRLSEVSGAEMARGAKAREAECAGAVAPTAAGTHGAQFVTPVGVLVIMKEC